MSKLDDLHTLAGLLKDFNLPVSPILDYAIKEKEEELMSLGDSVASETDSFEKNKIRKSSKTISSSDSNSPSRDRGKKNPSKLEVHSKETYSQRQKQQANQMREEFANYLHNNVTPDTAESILFTIDQLVQNFIFLASSSADSIYSIRTVQETKSCIEELKKSLLFYEENRRKNGSLVDALEKYIEFLEHREMAGYIPFPKEQVQKYLGLLAQMKRTRINDHISPHKPVLLLAVQRLIEIGKITNNCIIPDNLLEEEFANIWHQYVNDNSFAKFDCRIEYPFYHMGGEPFWNLVKTPKWEKRYEYSVAQLKKFYLYAELDKTLFELMKNPATSEQIKDCLKGMI